MDLQAMSIRKEQNQRKGPSQIRPHFAQQALQRRDRRAFARDRSENLHKSKPDRSEEIFCDSSQHCLVERLAWFVSASCSS